ncbi:hypothetical protein BJY52DRAFT_1228661 [Lactarius psammicola]|nr:hypothetical protein BJY52DRAFT_1228661 [Lactarius psammicola]
MSIVLPETSEPNEDIPDETLHFAFPGPHIVLRSCDSHNFRVPKLYITIYSPVLRELIQSVSNSSDVPNSEEQEPVPVVELPESKATLYSLLTFIFPVVPTLPSTPEEIMELLAVAQKYQMDSALAHIRGAIARQDPPFLRPETAFQVYFLAQQHGLHQEALQAARVTLRVSMTIEKLGDKLEFPGMTGAYLHELWKYHQRVRAGLKSGLLEFRHSGVPNVVRSLRCSSPSQRSSSGLQLKWLDRYTEFLAQVICIFWEALTAVFHEAIENADPTLTLLKYEPTSENSDPPSLPLCLDTPDASVTVQSSDQVNFRINKSPPDDEFVDGLPVIQLPEDADLLNSLISLLYPIPPVIPGSYEKVFALLAACQKYDMESVQSNIRDEIKLGRFPAPVEAEGFSAYAIATRMGLIPEMENPARLTLRYPMTFETLGEGLRSFKGRALCDLIRYRKSSNQG